MIGVVNHLIHAVYMYKKTIMMEIITATPAILHSNLLLYILLLMF